ncbi:histidine kinase [Candidatus Uabimicrobium amorphum]|uniref:Histidine kinase n=1 Tax=Uabimicrobium amorphum TaxID=2596890 RepID=A0A5S9IR89_UABAM|nr:response regulator [Candidatus Uabimicrobium amorphum]BBM86156.1 histidine kinase [Candidatus Uabimicrobium amorphum]
MNSKYKILIVDDKWENRFFLRTIMENIPAIELLEVENGKEAIDAWHNWQPNLIWMDMCMPIMNGFEATKTIRKLDTSCKTKIIAISAFSSKEDRKKISQLGCDDFVKKPCRIVEIHNCLKRHVPEIILPKDD